jgi:hypothetical protein
MVTTQQGRGLDKEKSRWSDGQSGRWCQLEKIEKKKLFRRSRRAGGSFAFGEAQTSRATFNTYLDYKGYIYKKKCLYIIYVCALSFLVLLKVFFFQNTLYNINNKQKKKLCIYNVY